jgi:uncharacterized protein YjbI with pentapeptide repeats
MPGESIWRRLRRKRVAGVGVPAPEKPAGDKLDTKEAEALASALNRSAERVQTLWISFLVFALYLAIATSTTTHRMLFLESPIKLPVLNIDLPLLGFYILAPIIFLVFHFYVLLNLVLLARTAKTFEDVLQRIFPQDGEAHEAFRMRIENMLFVQLLVGGKPEREGVNGGLLSLMALITLALAPVALILLFQVMFLPYHSEGITWLHRLLLLVDLLLVWTLWPGYRRGWGTRLWPKRSWWLVGYAVLTVVPLFYAVAIATFPDERMYVVADYVVTNWFHGQSKWPYGSNEFRGRPDWYRWMTPVNSLSLDGEDLIEDRKLAQIIEKNENNADEGRWVPVSTFVGRDLTNVSLTHADVRHVDFSGAVLNRADLRWAWATSAHFDGAQLEGAQFQAAQLQGASLGFAQLQDASLDRAQLQGASLRFAELQAASLDSARAIAATFDRAELQGASLAGAELQGASLDYTTLQGARLDNAQLQGASLDGAQLQGASFVGARLQAASFRNVFVWRTDVRMAEWSDTRVEDQHIGPKEACLDGEKFTACDWTAQSFENLESLVAEKVRSADGRATALDRIRATLDPAKAQEGEQEMANEWSAHQNSSPAHDAYEKSLSEQWRKKGCAIDGKLYAFRALLARLRGPSSSWKSDTTAAEFLLLNLSNVFYAVDRIHTSPFTDDSPEPAKLAAAFLDTENCPGARGLGEAEIAKLKEIRDRAPPPTPKP